NTKNFHNLPIPSLRIINISFSLLTLIILFIFFQDQYLKAKKTSIDFFVFTIALINGLSVILVDIMEKSILGPPILILAFLFQIFLLFYLGRLIIYDTQDFFLNSRIIILLLGLGLSIIFVSDLVGNFKTGYLPIYLVLIGNFMTLSSLLIFSTTVLLLYNTLDERSTVQLTQDVLIQIVTTTLSQTLNITIIREIPGINFPLQSFSLMLSMGVIFLTIVGIFSLFSNSKGNKVVVWILVIIFLGLEIATPFRNVIRVIAIYYIYKHTSLMKEKPELVTIS
ncbi:MAG: hypothetical protein ACXACP_13430, partial [Candidatus Hodarchaeales archaeon]